MNKGIYQQMQEARIEDITWVKIKDQVEGKCKSNT